MRALRAKQVRLAKPRARAATETLTSSLTDRVRALAITPVSRETEARLDRFVTLLLEWQRTTNLIAPSSVPSLWVRHIADSLQLIDLAPGNAQRWLDLGSGGGFPGIVMACAIADRTGAAVHLVESNAKKAAFLREAARVTGAPALVHPIRIEQFVDNFTGPVDVVTARALASLTKLYQYGARFLVGGALALLPKGQDVEAEIAEATRCWSVAAFELVPSRTDRAGRIVVARGPVVRRTV